MGAVLTQRVGRAAQLPAWPIGSGGSGDRGPCRASITPEILSRSSALMLDCALWGVHDPRDLNWLDPPPEAALSEARRRLASLEALDQDGRPTRMERRSPACLLLPRLGHMLVRAAERGMARTPAEVAVLLGERAGGSDADLELRLRRWRSERGPRAENAPAPAGAALARTLPLLSPAPPRKRETENALAACVAFLPFPDRTAKRRDALGRAAGPRSAAADSALDSAASPAACSTGWRWPRRRARRRARASFPSRPSTRPQWSRSSRTGSRRAGSVRFDPATGRIEALRERRLGAIRLLQRS